MPRRRGWAGAWATLERSSRTATTRTGAGLSTSSPWEAALSQLDEAAATLNLDPGVHDVLRNPKRVLAVAIPVRHDDDAVRVYSGFRVHHNTSRGPSKGGIRYHPDVTIDWTRTADFKDYE